MDEVSRPKKRRRVNRTEKERIKYFKTDPYAAKFDAYRVLCAICDKLIRYYILLYTMGCP